MEIKGLLSTLAITSLLSCQAGLAAEIYKWTDDKGQVHYGQKKNSPQAKAMQLKPSPTVDGQLQERNRKRDRLLEVYAEERKDRKAVALKSAQDKKLKKRKCEDARKSLSSYEQASRIYIDDAQGNQVNLTEAQRSQTLKVAREKVKKFCT